MSLLKGMNINNLVGDQINISRTSSRHFTSAGQTGPLTDGKGRSFESVLLGAMDQTNEYQMASDDLLQQMITNPDDVNVHDVTLGMAQAEMTLNLTKAVVDKAVKAYKEIITLR